MNWIKIEDRLPMKGQEILAYGQLSETQNLDEQEYLRNNVSHFPYSIKTVTYDIHNNEKYDSPWFFQGHCCCSFLYNVTHWAYLPELPE